MIVHLGEDQVVWARDVIAVVGIQASRTKSMRKLLMGLKQNGNLTTIGEETNGYVFTAGKNKRSKDFHVFATGLSPHSFMRRLNKVLAEDSLLKG